MDKLALIALLNSYITDMSSLQFALGQIVSDLSRVDISEVEIQNDKKLVVSKLAAQGQSVTSLMTIVPNYLPPVNSGTNPVSDPVSMLNALTSTVDDITSASSEILGVIDFTAKYAAANPDDRKKLSYESLFSNGWSVRVDLNGDGKTAELFNGTDAIKFITQGLIGSDALTESEMLMGLTSKFEKELFGFSVVEIAQDVDSLAKTLTGGNSAAELLSGNVLDKINNILTKTGGNNDYVDKIKNVIEMSKGLISAYNKTKLDLQTAVSEYTVLKDQVTQGVKLFDLPTTTIAPDEIVPTTTVIPTGSPPDTSTSATVQENDNTDPFAPQEEYSDQYP